MSRHYFQLGTSVYLLAAIYTSLSLGARYSEDNIIDVAATHVSSLDSHYTAAALQDQVTSMPGWGPLKSFKMFSGYITVDAAAGRALFYVFVESESDPVADPLMLWLNGGPGCSSLGGGFMSELGPFLPNKDGHTLKANPYPWNKKASVLFLESPAFVGWSYSNTSSDAIVGDARTAKDSRAFLLGFMERFPQFKSNDLYLSGESYAGHYVPNLAREIVRGNRGARSPRETLNLKGILVGNPLTDTAVDNMGAVDFWWHHAMISDETAEGIRSNCDFNNIGPLLIGEDVLPTTADALTKPRVIACDEFCDRAMSELGPINIYDIYADVCIPKAAQSEALALTRALGPTPAGLMIRAAVQLSSREKQESSNSADSSSSLTDEDPSKYDPCVDNEVETYMNLPEVQKALHANQTVILPWRWTDCTEKVQYSRSDVLASMLPVYEELLASGSLRILVFSGDVDGILPVVGTRRWVSGLGLPIKSAWRPWLSPTRQVGGHVIEYEGLIFASVRNAGHMVPYVQPERMFHLLTSFLNEESP
ncbi:hypothetical protein CEUSTIGMA_g7074.t1 [Chlamydomonas eustigma]|uniref:Carboxypeptidase n=1 Tax=Chlamydomonas eustigma TaxID=1157962 RepID=A0A250X973_9CHLO|nr:hypothetical protein CEUSTIGMA_g7074.t1 [Chlamydomonas eustigma]|eukprot:GAX79633.1 hypothetical protein CEUSTIGMA_g7074.t1 [Chlamydomonas eustigma]